MKLFIFLIFAVMALKVECAGESMPPKKNRQSRIFNGRDVSVNEQNKYKHQVKLITAKKDGNFECGGTILNAKVILTAAHCLTNANYVDVYFGIRNQHEIYNDGIKTQRVKPSGLRIHKDYDPVLHRSDIALIILPFPVKFTDNIGAIELASENDICSEYKMKDVTVSGWGKLNDKGEYPAILQTVDVKIADSKDCMSIYPKFFENKNMICASGAQRTGACLGDSGGPMILNVNGTPTIIGVASFTATGCAHSHPRVFTCVSGHYEWIQTNMRFF